MEFQSHLVPLDRCSAEHILDLADFAGRQPLLEQVEEEARRAVVDIGRNVNFLVHAER